MDHHLTPRSVRSSYADAITRFSNRLIELLRPLRVLEAVRWPESIATDFFAAGGRRLPAVTAASYRPLAFDPVEHHEQLTRLAREIPRRLGARDPAAGMLLRRCREVRGVVRLLECRGTPLFAALSRQLYGTTLGRRERLSYLLACLPETCAGPLEGPTVDSQSALETLSDRLSGYFGPMAVRLRLSDRQLADATARGPSLTIRRHAQFTPRQVQFLEVHEGWVHLGTTLNAQAQSVCTFLGKVTPSATRTQEGLAVLLEFLTDTMTPARLGRLRRRLQGLVMAEEGADFREAYRWFCDEGCPPAEAFAQAARLFRGSLPGAGPFTKDLCYADGLLDVCRALWLGLARGRDLRLLFVGKTALDDLEPLAQLSQAGLVTMPRYVPPLIRDRDALADRLTDLPFLHALAAPA